MPGTSTFADEAIGANPQSARWPRNRLTQWYAGPPNEGLVMEESAHSFGVSTRKWREQSVDVRCGQGYQNSAWTPILLFDISAEWLGPATRRLSELSKLEQNWDSYDAPAPNERSIKLSINALCVLADLDFKPSSIDPSAEGGVCLSFRNGGRYGDVEFFNCGEALAVTSTGQNDSNVWEVRDSRHALRMALETIRKFINE